MRRERRAAFKANLRGLAPYLAAATIYVAVCSNEPVLMLNWAPALGFLLVVVWIAPAAWRRWRR